MLIIVILRNFMKIKSNFRYLFLTSFILYLVMISLNEYITLPFVWYLIGIGLGLKHKAT